MGGWPGGRVSHGWLARWACEPWVAGQVGVRAMGGWPGGRVSHGWLARWACEPWVAGQMGMRVMGGWPGGRVSDSKHARPPHPRLSMHPHPICTTNHQPSTINHHPPQPPPTTTTNHHTHQPPQSGWRIPHAPRPPHPPTQADWSILTAGMFRAFWCFRLLFFGIPLHIHVNRPRAAALERVLRPLAPLGLLAGLVLLAPLWMPVMLLVRTRRAARMRRLQQHRNQRNLLRRALVAGLPRRDAVVLLEVLPACVRTAVAFLPKGCTETEAKYQLIN